MLNGPATHVAQSLLKGLHSQGNGGTLQACLLVYDPFTDRSTMPDSPSVVPPIPADFEGLAASRRNWIQNVLRAWCRQASLKELRKADLEWFDIAGRADMNATLWTWAWERFPEIVHPEMPGVHETFAVHVTLADGRTVSGFPDARQSVRGILVLVGPDDTGAIATRSPITIDEITAVSKA